MPSARVSNLTRDHIASTAKSFRWNRQMPKWSVMIEGRELPARPLVLEAAGVPPNDPTNSHQAVKILQDRGFDVHYQGKAVQETQKEVATAVTEQLIRSLRGRYKDGPSLAADREREHRIDKDRLAR